MRLMKIQIRHKISIVWPRTAVKCRVAAVKSLPVLRNSASAFFYFHFAWDLWAHFDILENQFQLKPVLGDLCSPAKNITAIWRVLMKPNRFFMCLMFQRAIFIDCFSLLLVHSTVYNYLMTTENTMSSLVWFDMRIYREVTISTLNSAFGHLATDDFIRSLEETFDIYNNNLMSMNYSHDASW